MEIEWFDAMIDLEEAGPTWEAYEKFIGTVGALTWSNVVSSKLCRYRRLAPLPPEWSTIIERWMIFRCGCLVNKVWFDPLPTDISFLVQRKESGAYHLRRNSLLLVQLENRSIFLIFRRLNLLMRVLRASSETSRRRRRRRRRGKNFRGYKPPRNYGKMRKICLFTD